MCIKLARNDDSSGTGVWIKALGGERRLCNLTSWEGGGGGEGALIRGESGEDGVGGYRETRVGEMALQTYTPYLQLTLQILGGFFLSCSFTHSPHHRRIHLSRTNNHPLFYPPTHSPTPPPNSIHLPAHPHTYQPLDYRKSHTDHGAQGSMQTQRGGNGLHP